MKGSVISYTKLSVVDNDDQEIEFIELRRPISAICDVPEVLGHILSFLPLADLLNCNLTCKQWHNIVDVHFIWKEHYDNFIKNTKEIHQISFHPSKDYLWLFFDLRNRTLRYHRHFNSLWNFFKLERLIFRKIRYLSSIEFIIYLIFVLLNFSGVSFGIDRFTAFLISLTISFSPSLYCTASLSLLIYCIIKKEYHYAHLQSLGITIKADKISIAMQSSREDFILSRLTLLWLNIFPCVVISSVVGIYDLITWQSSAYPIYIAIILYLISPIYGINNREHISIRIVIIYLVGGVLHVIIGILVHNIAGKLDGADIKWIHVFGIPSALLFMGSLTMLVFMNCVPNTPNTRLFRLLLLAAWCEIYEVINMSGWMITTLENNFDTDTLFIYGFLLFAKFIGGLSCALLSAFALSR